MAQFICYVYFLFCYSFFKYLIISKSVVRCKNQLTIFNSCAKNMKPGAFVLRKN